MNELNLTTPHLVLLERLKEKGIVELSSIQKESFAQILQGKSVIAHSKTGTGKTLAYLIPLVQKHLYTEGTSALEAPLKKIVVLVPTRELASQVEREVLLLTKDPRKTVVIVGGENEDRQIMGAQKALFVVATPGRLLDLLNRNMLKSLEVETLVFDEADRLLDMGFIDDMRDIVRRISRPSQQMLFYSATIHFGIEEMSYEFGSSELVRVGHDVDEMTVDGLSHKVAFIGEQEKFHALVHFLHKNGGRGIVFSNYRDKAHDITFRLQGLGCKAEALTAQLAQNARRSILDNFLKERVQVLVASDLAARGIDVKDLHYVVNYDLPEDPSTYVHRVGRTARAGKSGQALSFVGFEDSFRLDRLEKFLGKKIERYSFEASELSGVFPRWKTEEKPRSQALKTQPVKVDRPAQATQSNAVNTIAKSVVKSATNVPSSKVLAVTKPSSSNFFKRFFSKLLSMLGISPKPSSVPAARSPQPPSRAPHQAARGQGAQQGARYQGNRQGNRNGPSLNRNSQNSSYRGARDGQSANQPRNARRPK